MDDVESESFAGSKVGSVLLILCGTIGVPVVAGGGGIEARAVATGLLTTLFVIAGLFGFMSRLKTETVAEMREYLGDLRNQMAKLLEEKSKPAS